MAMNTVASPSSYVLAISTLGESRPRSLSPASDSLIPELQAALGSILIANKDDTSDGTWKQECTDRRLWIHDGSFRFLDLPGELRDEVYFHYLHRVNEMSYRQAEFGMLPNRPPGYTVSLFLVCKQVYQESRAALLRSHTLCLLEYGPGPQRYRDSSRKAMGVLRLMKDNMANLVHKISWEYYGLVGNPAYLSVDLREVMSARSIFEQILRDATLFKERFPCLQEFHAKWYAVSGQFRNERGASRFLARENESEEDPDGEQRARTLYEWMKGSVLEGHEVPRPEIRFEIHGWWQESIGSIWWSSETANRAFSMVLEDVHKVKKEDVETSGERWMEETCWKEEDEWWTGKKKTDKRRRVKSQ